MRSTFGRSVAHLLAPITVAALVAVSAPGRAEAIQDSEKFGMVGLTRGQTVRLNVVHVGNPNDTPCAVELRILDGMGNTLAVGNPDIMPGQAASLDLNADALGGPDTFGRFQVRAVVTLGGPDARQRELRACSNNLRSTLEIFDNATGQTRVILHPAAIKGFNPQPDPPGAPAGQ